LGTGEALSSRYQRNTFLQTNTTSAVTWRLVVALSTMVFLISGSSPAGVFGQASHLATTVADSGNADDSGTTTERTSRLSRSQISAWGAGSVYSGGVLGKIPAGWLGLVGLRYHRLLIPAESAALATHEAATLAYTADLVPVAAVSIPKGTAPGSLSFAIQSVEEVGLSTYGMGVYPMGLRVGFRPSATVRPFVEGHTGFFYLFDPIPDERGRRLNFAAGVGGGVQISLTRHTILTLGYRYHHLSNGFRGSINPGLDANLLYVGLGRTL
jgi:hypothetical protein